MIILSIAFEDPSWNLNAKIFYRAPFIIQIFLLYGYYSNYLSILFIYLDYLLCIKFHYTFYTQQRILIQLLILKLAYLGT